MVESGWHVRWVGLGLPERQAVNTTGRIWSG